MSIAITVRLYYPEAITQRELDAVECDLTDRVCAAVKLTKLPKGAFIEVGDMTVSELGLVEVAHG